MLTDDDFPDDLTPTPEKKWWDHPPTLLEESLHVLQVRAHKLRSPDDEGKALRKLLEQVESAYGDTVDDIRRQYPNAFFKPSYEQSLLLNAWWCGIDFPVCFAANRIGKTACFVINGILWSMPNNPDWEMFAANNAPNPADEGQSYIPNPNQHERFYFDLFGRPVQTLQRPPITKLPLLRAALKQHPELAGDPSKSHLEPDNAQKFATLQKLLPDVFAPAWPSPPIQESGDIWLGAPSNDFHVDIIMKEWKRWLPSSCIKKWSDSELKFTISTAETTNPAATHTEVTFICKSYESDDTVWSGSAVLGIILTEGLTKPVLNEVKQRIKVNGFGSWDYTPYEARNVGAKTALAFEVFKGKETVPLRSFIFTRFSARKAPAHVIPIEKRDDLIRMWDGKKEGEARLDGLFYSSSPLVLSKLDRLFHCVPWSVPELFERYPTGQIYRGLDPGYDHPTCCCWGLLVPGNIWFIYRYYSERMKTISERCRDIVTLSGNTLQRRKWGPKPDQFNLIESHLSPNSEVVHLTAADYHLFKTDEATAQPYILNYIKAGLEVTESTHMAPEDRAVDLDNKLDRSAYHVHPITGHTPGAKVFFLINGQGVDTALGKMESLFWERLAAGPNKGEAKDTVPSHKDDELDATCYLTCGPYVWTNFRRAPFDKIIEEPEKF